MTGHPAVSIAAAALTLGVDPMVFLKADTTERCVLILALNEAMKSRGEELKAIVNAVGASTGNRVAEIFVKAFR